MEISYNRTHRDSYMILQDVFVFSEYEERILKENEIHSLLPFHTMQADDKLQIWYDISGKQSLKDFLEQEEITLEILDQIFVYTMLALEELHKYLMTQEKVLLHPETIYVSRHSQFRLYFSYCPVPNKDVSTFSDIMECILSRVDHAQEGIMRTCYQLYEMSLDEKTTLFDLQQVVKKELEKQMKPTVENFIVPVEEAAKNSIDNSKDNSVDNSLNEEDVFYEDNWENMIRRIIDKGQKLLQMILGWRQKEQREIKRQDFYIEPEPEIVERTQLLYDGTKKCVGKLVYAGDQDESDYVISKTSFRIGHGGDGNDAMLQSNAVSRMHAKISIENDEYYIEDLNSTNGTYINGELLSYRQKQKLQRMDRIRFADVSYVFE